MAEATVASLQSSTTTIKHDTPTLLPFLRILKDRMRARGQWREDRGMKEGLRVPPAPLGTFRLRTRLPVDVQASPATAWHTAEGFQNRFKEEGHILWEEGVGSWKG
jgi:hypothetical protein